MPAPPPHPTRVVLVTVPDAPTGLALARTLVTEQLVACANLLPTITSIYRWDQTLHEAPEALLILKTTAPTLTRLETRLHELHPYSVPEFVVLDPTHVSSAYQAWLLAETQG